MSMSNDASSDSESRPTKRQRIESERIEKSTSIYHAHGDIAILSLPNDEGVITAFKIDKIYLSRNSAVFEGMVGLPSMEESEKFDGVPLVRLQDTAEQLGDFLEALYDSGYVVSFSSSSRHIIYTNLGLSENSKYRVKMNIDLR